MTVVEFVRAVLMVAMLFDVEALLFVFGAL